MLSANKQSASQWRHRGKVVFNHRFFEEYARITLEDIVPSIEGEFVVSDRPDIQNEKSEIGIEVTISIEQSIAEREAFGEKYLGQKISPEIKERFQGELYTDNEKVIAYSPTKGAFIQDSYKFVKESVKAKEKKAAQYRERFSKVGLYVFCPSGYIDEFDPTIIREECLSKYDFLIINIGERIMAVSKTPLVPSTVIKVNRERMRIYKQKAKGTLEANSGIVSMERSTGKIKDANYYCAYEFKKIADSYSGILEKDQYRISLPEFAAFVVNASFACEIGIKGYISTIDCDGNRRDPERTHKLDELFASLEKTDRERILRRVCEKGGITKDCFFETLSTVSANFPMWRYVTQYERLETNPGFLKLLMDAVFALWEPEIE